MKKTKQQQRRSKANIHPRGKRVAGNSARKTFSTLIEAFGSLDKWKSRWPDFEEDETLRVSREKTSEIIADLLARLEDNYPFHHPGYAGQMLKPPHPIASLAYFLTQQINPNNHALDGGPATAKMEMEVVSQLAGMFGFKQHLGHLTSSGTIANLEALWVARSVHPHKSIAFSSQAHYTHRRMCEVIGVPSTEIAVDGTGRMDLEDLRRKLAGGTIGTVVVTAGTTGLGAIDAIGDLQGLRKEFGLRIHVDAAYGGFFRLLADMPGALRESSAKSLKAMEFADSIVVDPHKHGLQPYGCGSVIFRDPSVGTFYKHDSPYTYFTSKDLHLGEISLECSRAGASAAALWATFKCFPLDSNGGLGAILWKTRKAAEMWSRLINESKAYRLVVDPELDILGFYPSAKSTRVSDITRHTHRIFERTMSDRRQPVYLAKMNLKRDVLAQHSHLEWDQQTMTVLRSVLMKPEHLGYVPLLHEQLLKAARP